jgi:hypothetical protein
VALADQIWRIKKTIIRESGGVPDRNEGEFHIEQAPEPAPAFVLDDLIAGLNNLKSAQGIPGTATIGSPVEFSLRWTG